MFSVHVISDLNFHYRELFGDELNIPEEADIVILNGNIGGLQIACMYGAALCKKYPDIPIILNLGEKERYWGIIPKNDYWETENGLKFRIGASDDWPKNLHWKDPRDPEGMLVTLRTGQVVSVYTDYGFPKIHSVEGNWEDTYWYKNYCIVGEYIHKLDKWGIWPKEADIVKQGIIPLWFTKDFMRKLYEEQELNIKRWETSLEHYGILVTHINPYQDYRTEGCVVSPYQIHMKNKLWVTTGELTKSINFLGGKLYSNPGRGPIARSNIIQVD